MSQPPASSPIWEHADDAGLALESAAGTTQNVGLPSEPAVEAMTTQDAASQEGQPRPPKRKGGRKPMYTSEAQRKQRNRQAQAAFRERRSDLMKQMQTQNKALLTQVAHLQADIRRRTEMVQMVSYKCSLLERIIRENGIDIHSELRSHSYDPSFNAPSQPQPQPQQQQPMPLLPRRSSAALNTGAQPAPPPMPTAQRAMGQTMMDRGAMIQATRMSQGAVPGLAMMGQGAMPRTTPMGQQHAMAPTAMAQIAMAHTATTSPMTPSAASQFVNPFHNLSMASDPPLGPHLSWAAPQINGQSGLQPTGGSVAAAPDVAAYASAAYGDYSLDFSQTVPQEAMHLDPAQRRPRRTQIHPDHTLGRLKQEQEHTELLEHTVQYPEHAELLEHTVQYPEQHPGEHLEHTQTHPEYSQAPLDDDPRKMAGISHSLFSFDDSFLLENQFETLNSSLQFPGDPPFVANDPGRRGLPAVQ